MYSGSLLGAWWPPYYGDLAVIRGRVDVDDSAPAYDDRQGAVRLDAARCSTPGLSTVQSRFPQTILATCCVPWTDDGQVHETIFRTSIQALLSQGMRDLYVFGTAGEGYAVSERLFDDVVELFVEETRRADAAPMVGVISLSLPTVIERIERCANRGVELFQISLPSWAALNDRELVRFFAETCGRFPELRFLHYNLPRAKRLVTPEEYADLAASYPNLVATKNAAADRATIAALFRHAGALRHFFTEPNFGFASSLGPCGFLISVASMNPTLAMEYFEACLAGDTKLVDRFERELAAIDAELENALGASRIDGAYDKCFSKLHQPEFPLRLLPPYEGASDAEYGQFVGAVRKRHARWLPD